MKILASVHDKTNLTAFLKGISQFITEVYASGNTYRPMSSHFREKNFHTTICRMPMLPWKQPLISMNLLQW